MSCTYFVCGFRSQCDCKFRTRSSDNTTTTTTTTTAIHEFDLTPLALVLPYPRPTTLSWRLRPGSASDATQALEAAQNALDGEEGLTETVSANATSTAEVVAQNASAAAARANDADATVHGAIPEVVTEAEDPAAAAAAAALGPFQSIQGMGPAMLTSLLRFARADTGNRPVVETLASEVRFAAAPQGQRRRQRSRVVGGGQGSAGAWVEGKTVVFTGSLTRQVLFFFLLRGGTGLRE